jgi:plastocyanin
MRIDVRPKPFCLILLAALGSCLGCAVEDTGYVPADTKLASAIRETLSVEAVADEGAGPTATPTGWGTLKGKFALVGDPPANTPLAVSGEDMSICAPGGKSPLDEKFIVGAGGSLKNVVVYLSSTIPDTEPWTHPDAAPGKALEPAIFDQKNCIFLSRILGIRAGQPVTIKNSDPTGHNTNIKAATAFNQIISAGSASTWTPKKEEKGPVDVSCSIHPWMKSYMLIRNNGYFAISGDDGAIEIANLPAGVPLEFRVWHESVTYLDGIEILGQKVKKGRFTMTLNPSDPAANEFACNIDAAVLSK